MIEDLKTLAAVAVIALIAGFCGYIGWDSARALIPVVIPLLQEALGR